MEDLKRMRVITAHYRNLQGFRMLPWFLWVLVLSAVNPVMGLPQGQLDYQCLVIVPGLAIPWMLSRLIGKYYDHAFGRIETLPPRNRPVEVLVSVAFVVIAYFSFFIDSLQRLPVSVFGFVMAVAMFIQWWMSGRFLTHCLVTAALLTGISLLPLAGAPADGHWTRLFGGFIAPIAFGVILSIGSVLGHVVLVRNLKALSQVES